MVEMAAACSLVSAAKPLIFATASSLPSTSRSGGGKNDSPSNLPLASKIFVRNLSYSTTVDSLVNLFSRFGHVVEVKLAHQEERKRSKGYAFIQYSTQEDAILAVEEMDLKLFNGRKVYVEIAKPMHGGFIAYPKTSGPPSTQFPEAD
ncbi:hypothetical protein HPP92_015806 [Vanilla planifolia]|uniref:RRM domain-containing protein n=1 Tax=Vanilla planifolia TaxID=51239 RepID=A0A835QLM5_VANPL|nr:hypothetical protein HPP92_026369 [Vanilla planifolia]KAG0469721.1 hypothetical protein HPP92_016421 [Vanilla planifolia]KAG0471137.1 hypothetical protein HPP92_015683 [Vanilla planifolia]KAG0471260.1 hypothetical protein HPP92_015806 [Vanilla planifolia]